MKNEKFRFLWIGHAAFLVLFVLAAVLYIERSVFVDCSYFSFTIINERTFFHTLSRFASQIPQIIPLIGVWTHLPLKFILFLFSVSYIIEYYLIFLISAYILKNGKISLAIPFVLLLGTKYSFYWCVTETHPAIVFSVLLGSFLFYSASMKPGGVSLIWKILIAALIILLSLFSHPVGFFSVLFVIGYFIVDQKKWKDPYIYLLIVVLGVSLLLLMHFLSGNQYESGLYERLFIFYQKLDFTKSESFRFLVQNAASIYLFSGLVFLATSVFYLWKKEFLKLAYYVISIAVILLVIFVTFDELAAHFISEKELIPLNVFLLVPFFREVIFSDMKYKLARVVFLLVFLGISAGQIISAHPDFANRLKYIKHVTDLTKKLPEKKFLMEENYADKSKIWMIWAFGTESLLLTSLDGPDSSRTVYVPANGENVFVDLNDPDICIAARWDPDVSIKKMDKHLFNLGNGIYRKLSAGDIFSEEKYLLNNSFDKPEGNDTSYQRDETGNGYYVLGTEFGPGYGEYFHKISATGRAIFHASISVRPFEDINARSFGIVISKINDGNGFEYYHSSNLKPVFFPQDKWTEISVSGIISSHDTGDIVKIYLWNPERIRMMIDDMKIGYMEDR